MSESEAVTVKSFPTLLKAHAAEIGRALPAHLSADRMARIALTAFRRNPKLAECDPRSVFACVIQSAQLGLEPDTLGRSYLIPYKVNKKTAEGWKSHYECQFVPGWKGLVDLMNRSGSGSVWTGAVFAGDEFDYQCGDSPFVRHRPRGDATAAMTHVYAVGRTKGSDWPIIEIWTAERCEKHRNRYNKVGEAHYSFQNWEMYCRKVVLLQVMKYMPCSAEMVQAIALNDASEIGRQMLSVDDAIQGTWVEAPKEESDESESDADTKSGGAKLKAAATKATPTSLAQSTGAPTVAEVAKMIQAGRLDEAADLARSFPEADRIVLQQQIEKARATK